MIEKNWYIIYTKLRSEKKVAELLTKKNIANYCPLAIVNTQFSGRRKTTLEPLFTSYVFVQLMPTDQLQLKKIEGIINLAYWKNVPVVISDLEIESIRSFLNEHKNIRVEKIPVNLNEKVKVVPGNSIQLSSFGYTITAEPEIPVQKLVKVNFFQRRVWMDRYLAR